ncbi:bifunctional serine/threonine-protein kinase/formylglycine-generating enzyme family protein [Sorangium sp. So ce513]|uniref:bifunctional serine/threonine-protein kinase/formylglycine-generating enzyme family protein n=1 Tax=Sorangium sp. So ce513 TaxID=3133315 RepID=UPI003F632097
MPAEDRSSATGSPLPEGEMKTVKKLPEAAHPATPAAGERQAPATERTFPLQDDATPSAPRLALPERYQDIRLLGSGGFGEVRLVFDVRLERTVAMKILRPDAVAPTLSARFLAEIQLTAGLDHPGIVPVYDYGALADGRLWFTMAEVRGRTLRTVLDEAFAAPGGVSSVVRRRLLDVFARVCDAVAYAHSRGVIHRDLKPDNIMVGDFGRVLVMDWGIARRLDARPEDPEGPPSPERFEHRVDGLTRYGDVLGTPAYMAPEQARGDVGRHGPKTDVYALGAILYYALSGRPPYTGQGAAGFRQVLESAPEPLSATDAPPDLVAICERAMAREPEHRYPDAGALAADIEAFLGGAQRRERALAELAKAAARRPEITRLRARAEALRAEAKLLLDPVRPFDPVDAKLPGWEREDEAERLLGEAALAETMWEQEVHGALALDPDLPEAHAALADHYRDKLVEAERARRRAEAARLEVLLRAHDRGRHAAFLSGMGALTLVTEPAGARVTLYRYATFQRRLVPELVGELGPTPIVDRPLPHGSYLLRIAAPGRAEVSYPVLIARGERWDGRPPGGEAPYPVPLPAIAEMDPGEVYVPAGWTWIGGDAEAPDSLPRRLVWIDGFIAGRFPITNEEYLAFLNDLVASGRDEEALAACPRAPQGIVAGADEKLAYERLPDGRFGLKDHDLPEIWRPRGPAVLMTWHGAMAYARWLSARTGRPYRLLHELEREKATRGVDGRFYPWGDHFDPTWARSSNSHSAGQPSRVDVDEYPLDESPYGLRGVAGNSRDWCLNLWTRSGPRIDADGRLVLESAPPDGDAFRAGRGGAWSSVENHCRAAARFAGRPAQPRSTAGLRVARPYR